MVDGGRVEIDLAHETILAHPSVDTTLHLVSVSVTGDPNPSGTASRPDRWGVPALGLVTITAYGSWFYGFGVLLDLIVDDTGWGTTAMGATFGAAQIITGLGAVVGGRLLDRFGGPGPFGVQLAMGVVLLFAASFAQSMWVFGAAYAVGAGIIGATGFYPVTTAAAARLHPGRPDRAIAHLTIIGAFSSPIFLPLTAWFAESQGWRPAMRLLAGFAAIGAAAAAWFARRAASPADDRRSTSPIEALRAAIRQPEIRRMLVVYAAAGLAFSSVLVYQVPIMTGAGISLGVAGTIGGLRGFCQVFGRIGLATAVERFGARRLLQAAYAAGAVGVLFLAVGSVVPAVVFALLAGVSLGATSPLQPMYARQYFAPDDLGLLMGLQGAAFGLAGGIGPVVGGAAHEITGSWVPTIGIAAVALFVSAAGLADRSRA